MSFIGSSPKVNRLRLQPRSSDPVSPAEGDLQYADGTARAEGLWTYTNGDWVAVGTDVGTGMRNYVDQSDSTFESGVANWFTFDDGSAYVDGTGGTASNLSISTTTTASEVLNGLRSLKISKAAADAQYEGTSVALLTIDRADLGRTLYGSMEVDATHANYDSLGLKIFAYDITNAAILPVLTDLDGIPQGKGKVLFRILPTDTTADIRLSIMVNTTNASAYDVFVDDVQVGPAAQIEAPIIKNWKDYTPTGTWVSNSTYSGKWARVGDTMEVQARVDLTGAPTNTELDIGIPSGYTIDTTKLTSATTGTPLGFGYLTDSGTTVLRAVVVYSTSTAVRVRVTNTGGTYGNVTALSSTVPFTWASGDIVDVTFRVPISGWSASAILSTTEAANQTIAFRASRNGTNQTGVTTNNSVVQVLYNSTSSSNDYDSGLVYDSSNSQFVCVRPGKYNFTASILITGTNVLNARHQLSIRVNGSDRLYSPSAYPPAGQLFSMLVAGDVNLVVGDVVTVGIYGAGNNSVNTLTISGSTGLTYFTGHSLPDFTTFGVFGETEYYEVGASTGIAWPVGAGSIFQASGGVLTLTPGEWELTAHIETFNNGVLDSDKTLQIGINTTSASFTGLTRGQGYNWTTTRSTSGDYCALDIPKYRVIVSSTTSYYLNLRATRGTVNTNLQLDAWLFTARRIR